MRDEDGVNVCRTVLAAFYIIPLKFPAFNDSARKIGIFDTFPFSTFHSFTIATVDLRRVQFWQLPLNPLSSKQLPASLQIRKTGRSGSTKSSQPASVTAQ
jgi:hypothetical protein